VTEQSGGGQAGCGFVLLAPARGAAIPHYIHPSLYQPLQEGAKGGVAGWLLGSGGDREWAVSTISLYQC
jgi:hypothetical protein